MVTNDPNQCFLLLLLTAILLCFRPCAAQGNSTCGVYGRCGAFGRCNAQESPICACLQGFYPNNPTEWAAGNWTSGCARRVPLRCEKNASREDGFVELQMMKISGYSIRLMRRRDECEGICLRNCSCIAYAWDVGIGCMFWIGPLMEVQKFQSGLGSDFYIRMPNSELDHKKDDIKKIVIAPVVIGFVVMSICIYFLRKWIAKRELDKKRATERGKAAASEPIDSSLQEALSRVNLEDMPLFKYDVLALATDNFSNANRLGRGGFGPVYKGKLANGRMIAVKRLSKASGQGMQEFMNEIVLISKLQHRNLVRLLGCSVENKETMLVYEYMPNKSLDFFLFDPAQEILDWQKRINIIQGICRGLIYLHRDSRLKIIHRDLKPSNILLDDDWNPKISDFGMARIFIVQKDHISTKRVVGTFGYMAPEYAMEGRFSEKSDVFSFGVLMLEISTGRRNTSFYNNEGSLSLLGHVWKMWNENNVADLIDPRISDPSCRADVARCLQIGLLCVQELPKDRPSIPSVLSMLRSDIINLPEPKQSAFVFKSNRYDTAGTSSSQQSQKSSRSLNYVTFTAIDAR